MAKHITWALIALFAIAACACVHRYEMQHLSDDPRVMVLTVGLAQYVLPPLTATKMCITVSQSSKYDVPR
jgi:hypothetical protein